MMDNDKAKLLKFLKIIKYLWNKFTKCLIKFQNNMNFNNKQLTVTKI